MKRAVFAAVLLAAAALLAGCGARFDRYGNAGSYTVGAASYSAAQVHDIEIGWLDGAVYVQTSETATEITVSESRAESDDYAVRTAVVAGVLNIMYAKSGVRVPGGLQKILTVTLPAGAALGEVEADTTAATVSVSGVTALEVTADTASGDILFSDVTATSLTADTVSGSVLFRGCTFAEGEADTTSGNAVFVLGEIDGFRLDFEGRGAFTDEYGAVKQGRVYVYGNGRADLSFESVSGSLALRKSASPAE